MNQKRWFCGWLVTCLLLLGMVSALGEEEPGAYERHRIAWEEALIEWEAERGPFPSWSYETFADFYAKTGFHILGVEGERVMLPEPEDLSYEDALARLREIMADQVGMSEEQFADFPKSLYFVVREPMDGEPQRHWYFAFYDLARYPEGIPARGLDVLPRWQGLIASPGGELLQMMYEYPDQGKGLQLGINLPEVLYWNPSGGTLFHAQRQCPMEEEAALPLAAFPARELAKPEYLPLVPCVYCIEGGNG